jgi:hypothetical protein
MPHLLLLLLLYLPITDSNSSTETVQFLLTSSLCVNKTDDVIELSSRRIQAFAECADSPTCWHLLTVTSQSFTRYFSVTQVTPELTDIHNQDCEIYSKFQLTKNFKELSVCPVEGELNVQPLQLLPLAGSVDICAFSCLSSVVCEFFRFNDSCYVGFLSAFMAYKSAGDTSCRVWKRIRHWDDKYEAFYSFNHSFSNLADVTRYNMTQVGSPTVTSEGVQVSGTDYLKTGVTSPSLLNNFFKLGKNLTFVMRMKRTLTGRDSAQWLTISESTNLGNYAAYMFEDVTNKQLNSWFGCMQPQAGIEAKASVSEFQSPNQENWICVSFTFAGASSFWTVNGVKVSAEIKEYSNVEADHKWQTLTLAKSPNQVSLTGVIQSFAIIGSDLSGTDVSAVC